MKQLKIMGLMLMAIFALGAFVASTAMALEEGLLPNANFEGKGGEQVLENLEKEKIVCKEVKILEGKFNAGSDDEGTANLHFTGCTASGLKLAANSLGDTSGIILAKVKFNICLVNSEKLVFGIAIEATEKDFHIEVPSVKELVLVNGMVIAELEGAGLAGKVFKYKLEGKEGMQTIALKCEALGKKFEHNYLAASDSKVDNMASQKGLFEIEFAEEVKLED